MGKTKFTKNQINAITATNSNILVAAAAGAGKTTVLVERVINKIIKEKVDIDKLLIVTFTNATASEMKEKISEEIYKKLEENPLDLHLQKQIILLNKANISTIHAFCLDIIRNNFFKINVSPNIRVINSSEIEILKQEILEEVFDQFYEINDEDFLELINIYSNYRDDEVLKEIVLQIYNYIQSMPEPIDWLQQKTEEIKFDEKDFSKTIWGKIIIDDTKEEIKESIKTIKLIIQKLKLQNNMEKTIDVLLKDIDILEIIFKKEYTWDELYEIVKEMNLEKWSKDKNVTEEQKELLSKINEEQIKKIRDKINNIKNKIFIYNSIQAMQDANKIYEILKKLSKVIISFSNKFQEKKKEEDILDYNDIEHYALEILENKNEKGEYEKSNIAKEYEKKFLEIAIDEYQDSNFVQEKIINLVSNGKNIFMIGDIKQSIYKFRNARPELFKEKYDKYDEYNKTEETKIEKNNLKQEKNEIKGTKIKLFENFRSRENIIDFTNKVFESIMTKELGDVEYNEEEYLNFGADYPDTEYKIEKNGKVEIDLINLKKEIEVETEENIQLDSEIEKEENNFEEYNSSDFNNIKIDEEEIIDKKTQEETEIEAKFVANRIKQIIESKEYIYDRKQGYRKVEYKDIVILLRKVTGLAKIYETEILKLNIPVFNDATESYLETEEIQIILSALKIIDNPNNDIALISIIRSNIFGFTDNDLIEIKKFNKDIDIDIDKSFYEILLKYKNDKNKLIINKINHFVKTLENWQQKQEYLNLDELIWYIYETTGFYSYITLTPNSKIKLANLKMLFEKAKQYEMNSFKGLYNFIKFIEKTNNNKKDSTSAKIIGENENVIRIMTIHKSKGLEFPIVFLSSTNKNFNFQDFNQKILLNQEIGFRTKIY